MMKKVVILILFLLFLSCDKKESNDLLVCNYNTLKPLLEQKDNKTYVVNFWATWCKPCVKELPAFEKLHSEFEGDKLQVILVSLDFDVEALKSYIKNNELKPKVILLDDPDQNTWIPKIDKEWTGSIPATLIFNKNKRVFYEQSFTYKELKQTLDNFLN